jgi:O-acetyl-ADP-ribose deacetylase (regulator of RNase III)
MIEITHGDLLLADAEALVNTVNCVGVMGRGIALQFRKEPGLPQALWSVAQERLSPYPLSAGFAALPPLGAG